MKQKSFFIIFKGLSMNQVTQIILEGESPALTKSILQLSGIHRQLYFFSVRVFFTGTNDSQDNRGREGTIFYFTLPLPPAHEH